CGRKSTCWCFRTTSSTSPSSRRSRMMPIGGANMSSIEQGRPADELIREFHARELMPLAERLAREGRTGLALRPDPVLVSYYRRHSRTPMSRQDFEVPGLASIEELQKALVELWTREGFPELAALTAGVAR